MSTDNVHLLDTRPAKVRTKKGSRRSRWKKSPLVLRSRQRLRDVVMRQRRRVKTLVEDEANDETIVFASTGDDDIVVVDTPSTLGIRDTLMWYLTSARCWLRSVLFHQASERTTPRSEDQAMIARVASCTSSSVASCGT